ncbi:MAG TPA: hypothetical protein VN812_01890 [Candidatus Acidoferrales bacterium]|nr:hypothetical protein [Candidatus Acidoferrales bacterium]
MFASEQASAWHGMLPAFQVLGMQQELEKMRRKGEDMNAMPSSEVAVNARLLQVGLEVFPVYGDDKSGWSLDPGDLFPRMPMWFRYQSIDEIFFALVNLNVGPEGRA